MQARILDHDSIRVTSDLAAVRAALADKQMIWIELEKQDADADAVLAALDLHPLTVEDIWATRTFPKLDDFDNYVYAIIHGISAAKDGAVKQVELDVVLGTCFVVTHDPSGYVWKDVAAELDRSPRLLAKGAAWLAHALLDRAVDKYLPVIDDLDTQIETLENDVLRCAGTPKGAPVLRRILRFKRMLLDLRRMGIHQREILLRFGRGELEEVPAEAVPFFRDVYDHFLRINDLVESFRDLVTSSLEAYLSVQSNRMNEIMKTLTLIATVMLPITFIAGVYGMNFKHMPELDWLWGYPYALGLMAAVTIVSMVWFWRKGWDRISRARPSRRLIRAGGCRMMCVPMRRLLGLVLVCAAAASAEARTATGYHEGEKVEIKVTEVAGAECEVHTALAFRAMAKAANHAGVDLRIRSGFRNHAKQQKLYKAYRSGRGNLAAIPGYSNHESGRALDLVITDYKVYEWLQGHASKFGFHRTVSGEPWHWEYLGGYQPEHDRKMSARDGHGRAR